MSGIRLLIGLPIAALITTALFLMMNGFISKEGTVNAQKDIQKIVINAPTDTKVEPIKKISILPEDLPDAPPPVNTKSTQTGKKPIYPSLPPDVPKGPGGDGIIGVGNILTPIVRIEPVYPERCALRGTEGSVLVEFDITPEGAVINPRILSTANRCFNKAVINAVTRWRYSPTGRLVRGQKTTLTFRLAE